MFVPPPRDLLCHTRTVSCLVERRRRLLPSPTDRPHTTLDRQSQAPLEPPPRARYLRFPVLIQDVEDGTVRMTGVSKNTIAKLLLELGAACTRYQDETLRNLSCKRLQCDEIWSFVGGKDKNLSSEKKEAGLGSIWTWTAHRCRHEADPVVARRLARCGLGLRVHAGRGEPSRATACSSRRTATSRIWTAVEDAFGADIDYAMLHEDLRRGPDRREALQPGDVPRLRRRRSSPAPGPEAHLHVATWSARTSRCGCPCAASRG